jgi:hypothetical protein
VDSLRVAVVDVFPKQPSQVVFVQDDHVIEQHTANAADDALGSPVPPWAPEGLALWVYPTGAIAAAKRPSQRAECFSTAN